MKLKTIVIPIFLQVTLILINVSGLNINTSYSSTHNTYSSREKIKYIIIHYVAGKSSKSGQAINVTSWFKNPDNDKASADFIVDDELIIQYNPDPEKYATWAVGGSKYNTLGGSMHGIIKNKNSISIEICNSTKNCEVNDANNDNNYFSEKALNNAIELTKFLMEKYNIPASNVYRHYDVTGKLCPGIIGWNKESGSEAHWISFKNELESVKEASISSNNNSEYFESTCNKLEIDTTQYENQQDINNEIDSYTYESYEDYELEKDKDNSENKKSPWLWIGIGIGIFVLIIIIIIIICCCKH